MSQTFALDTRPVALEVHKLLREMDPSRWREGFEAALRARCKGLANRLEQLVGEAPEAPLSERLSELSEVLGDVPVEESPDAWTGFREQVQDAYESLSESLREASVTLPAVRPTNYVRSFWHATVSLLLVVLVEEVLTRRQLWLVPLCFASSFWFMEGLRQYTETGRRFLLWVFGPIAHPHERYVVNSSTWFGSALVIVGALFDPMICAVAVVSLGVGDPAAGLVGRRFGRTKLVGQRSLEGSLAMLFVAGFATFVVLSIWHGALPVGTMLAVSAATALFATVAELFSGRIDDNFSIPVAAACGGWLALQAATVIV